MKKLYKDLKDKQPKLTSIVSCEFKGKETNCWKNESVSDRLNNESF